MLRIQHYVEFCYLMALVFVIYDLAHVIKWKEKPTLRGWAMCLGFLVFAPFVLAYFAVRKLREEW